MRVRNPGQKTMVHSPVRVNEDCAEGLKEGLRGYSMEMKIAAVDGVMTLICLKRNLRNCKLVVLLSHSE